MWGWSAPLCLLYLSSICAAADAFQVDTMLGYETAQALHLFYIYSVGIVCRRTDSARCKAADSGDPCRNLARWQRPRAAQHVHERQKAGALDCVSSAMPLCALFTLDSGRCRHTQDDKSILSEQSLKAKRNAWQPSFADRRVRDSLEYAEFKNYIWQNPVKRGLARTAEEYPYSSAHPSFRATVGMLAQRQG